RTRDGRRSELRRLSRASAQDDRGAVRAFCSLAPPSSRRTPRPIRRGPYCKAQVADAFSANSLRWLWVPAPVRNRAQGRDDKLKDSLASHLGADDAAEQVPFAALELHHLGLLDRGEIGGAGVDGDACDQRIRREVLQARGLLHHVLARE